MKKEKQGRISIVLVLAIVAVVGFLIITLIQLRMDIKEKEKTVAEYSSKIAEQDEENSQLQDILNSEDESEYILQYAHENLDYVMPGERVYADSAN